MSLNVNTTLKDMLPTLDLKINAITLRYISEIVWYITIYIVSPLPKNDNKNKKNV